MKFCDYRFLFQGDELRVLIAGDVVSLPGYAGKAGWSMGGFGPHISEDWLLAEGDLPGSRARRAALASMLVRAVRKAHGEGAMAGDGVEIPRGPFARCPACEATGIPGFVPVAEGEDLVVVLTRGEPS